MANGNKVDTGMKQGTVLWFSAEKGFGFIRMTCDCGRNTERAESHCAACGARTRDVYVHFSGIDGPAGRRNLLQDQRVAFEIIYGPRGGMANQVQVINPE
jgi:CspA family cold shock protein